LSILVKLLPITGMFSGTAPRHFIVSCADSYDIPLLLNVLYC